MRPILYLLLSALLAGMPAAALADTRAEQLAFTVKLRGLTVGALTISYDETDTTYAATLRIENAGLASVVRAFRFDGTSRGALRDGLPESRRYEEVADTGRRNSRAVLVREAGGLRLLDYASTSPWGEDSPDPASQGDTVDPVAAVYAVFRAQMPERVCGRTLIMFDGKRRSRLQLGPPSADATGLRCTGEYRRLQGFTAKELSRNVAFPMVLIYAPGPDGLMRVQRVEVTSAYGLATLDRR